MEKPRSLRFLQFPWESPWSLCCLQFPWKKTNSQNFLLTKVFWLILVLNMDTYISTYMIYKLTEWIIMIHGNWKDHNYFRFFHGNCKHYNDHVLSHGNCKNHNDLGFSMGIVGITIIFLCFVAYNYHGKNQNNCDTYNYHVKIFFLLSVDNFQYLRKAKWW